MRGLIILLDYLLFNLFFLKILLSYFFLFNFWSILRITCIILKHFNFHIFILNIWVLLFWGFWYNFFNRLSFCRDGVYWIDRPQNRMLPIFIASRKSWFLLFIIWKIISLVFYLSIIFLCLEPCTINKIQIIICIEFKIKCSLS